MSGLTRRGFVKNSAATTAGMTAIGALLAEHAKADAEAHPGAPGSEPVVAYMRDPGSGNIAIMAGNREVMVHDPKLAARIARAAG
jgi:hypothetical protein